MSFAAECRGEFGERYADRRQMCVALVADLDEFNDESAVCDSVSQCHADYAPLLLFPAIRVLPPFAAPPNFALHHNDKI